MVPLALIRSANRGEGVPTFFVAYDLRSFYSSVCEQKSLARDGRRHPEGEL